MTALVSRQPRSIDWTDGRPEPVTRRTDPWSQAEVMRLHTAARGVLRMWSAYLDYLTPEENAALVALMDAMDRKQE